MLAMRMSNRFDFPGLLRYRPPTSGFARFLLARETLVSVGPETGRGGWAPTNRLGL